MDHVKSLVASGKHSIIQVSGSPNAMRSLFDTLRTELKYAASDFTKKTSSRIIRKTPHAILRAENINPWNLKKLARLVDGQAPLVLFIDFTSANVPVFFERSKAILASVPRVWVRDSKDESKMVRDVRSALSYEWVVDQLISNGLVDQTTAFIQVVVTGRDLSFSKLRVGGPAICRSPEYRNTRYNLCTVQSQTELSGACNVVFADGSFQSAVSGQNLYSARHLGIDTIVKRDLSLDGFTILIGSDMINDRPSLEWLLRKVPSSRIRVVSGRKYIRQDFSPQAVYETDPLSNQIQDVADSILSHRPLADVPNMVLMVVSFV
jgi:prepilin-type processing-associated H-X9-DG protein